MNSVQLVGRFTREPEIRYTEGGLSIARFTLAVDRRFKKDGAPNADFIRCIAFGKTAEFIEKYFNKGNKIGIIGRIQTGDYTNADGVKVYTIDVVVESAEFVESKAARSQSGKSGFPPEDKGGFLPADVHGFLQVEDGAVELPF